MALKRLTALLPFYVIVVVIIISTCSIINRCSATYLPWNRGGGGEMKDDKSNVVRSGDPTSSLIEAGNDLRRHHSAFFKDDVEIMRYLKGQGRQLKLWSCRNAIQQVYTRHKPLPHVELFCDVIGSIHAVTWSFRGLQLAGCTNANHSESDRMPDAYRYWLTVTSHNDDGRYYTTWLDFRLCIANATRRDSGIYWFQATSPNGDVERHAVFVDIMPVTSQHNLVFNEFKMAAIGSERKRKKKLEKRPREETTTNEEFKLRTTSSYRGSLKHKMRPI